MGERCGSLLTRPIIVEEDRRIQASPKRVGLNGEFEQIAGRATTILSVLDTASGTSWSRLKMSLRVERRSKMRENAEICCVSGGKFKVKST